MTKILLTGGHAATPALALAQKIVKTHPDWDIYWIGPDSAMEGLKVATAAEKTLKDSGVQTFRIIAGRLKKKGNILDIIIAYLKIPFGFFHALAFLIKISPNMIISFGGFAAFPVVFIGWLLGKPVIIHEQITGAGLANKLSAPFAKKIAVARSESLPFFPKGKTMLVGNPQVEGVFNVKKKTNFGNPPAIFITGGSSGSQIINNTVDEVLEGLLARYIVYHQTGDANIGYFKERKGRLSEKLDKRYHCFGYVSPNGVAGFFEKADVVVGRAGANTVADVVASRRPAILIPIPWSIGNEQVQNALKAQACGIAVILNQEGLTGAKLLKAIEEVFKNWKSMVKRVKPSDFDLDRDASGRLVAVVEACLRRQEGT